MFDSKAEGQFSISSLEYNEFCKFLEKESGIKLGADKKYLVTSRLSSLINEKNIASISALIKILKYAADKKLKTDVIDAMTTNETNWFRDAHPYMILTEKILPEFKDKQKLRIWSAACSTGQEPYSISMSITEYGDKTSGLLFEKQTNILATDLSFSTLEKAKVGEYTSLEIERGIDQQKLKRFFYQLDTGKNKIKEFVKDRVTFQQFNLLDSFDSLGKFDIVFCRNVLIYFSMSNKIDIINRVSNVLNSGGYLILGASEFIPSECNQHYKMISCEPGIIYQKVL